MNENILTELSTQSIICNKTEDCLILWQNSWLCILNKKSVQVFELTHNVQCLDKSLDIVHSSIDCPEYSPASFLFALRNINEDIGNMEFTQLIVNPSYWPHNPELAATMFSVSKYAVSPMGLIPLNGCVMALLNDIGGINLYAQHNYQWRNVLNLSSVILEKFKTDITASLAKDKGIQNLKKNVDVIETRTMCWAPKLNKDKSCYFVTCQNNGNICFWLLTWNGISLQAFFTDTICMDNFDVVTLAWIPKDEDDFVLILSNALGQIVAIDCSLKNGSIKNSEPRMLWKHRDRIISHNFQYVKRDNKTILVCDKYRHLLVKLLDENFVLISQSVIFVNDFKIVSVINNCNVLYVGTVNSKIYKIDVNTTDNTIDVKVKLIEAKLSVSMSAPELLGFAISENGIFALVLLDRKVMVRKEPNSVIIAFCSNKSTEQIYSELYNNPSQSLTYLWDTVAVLRSKAMKNKILPPKEYYCKLYNEGSGLYNLRLYFILLKMRKQLESMVKVYQIALPEDSFDVVRNKILLLHAKRLINMLYNSYKTGNLNDFQSEMFVSLWRFLKHSCKKQELDEFKDILSADIPDVNFICQSCDKILQGFTCPDGHINIFCSISLTLIESDSYLVCKICSATARIELLKSEPKCVFCDVYMTISCLPT